MWEMAFQRVRLHRIKLFAKMITSFLPTLSECKNSKLLKSIERRHCTPDSRPKFELEKNLGLDFWGKQKVTSARRCDGAKQGTRVIDNLPLFKTLLGKPIIGGFCHLLFVAIIRSSLVSVSRFSFPFFF